MMFQMQVEVRADISTKKKNKYTYISFKWPVLDF